MQSSSLVGCDPLLVVGGLSLGGSESQAVLLAKGLTERGFRPGIVVWTHDHDDFLADQLIRASIPLTYAPQNSGRLAKISWLRSIASRVRPQVMQSMAFYLNSAVAIAMWR